MRRLNGNGISDFIERVRADIVELMKQQDQAMSRASVLGMTDEEIRAYGRRGKRLQELMSQLSQNKPRST